MRYILLFLSLFLASTVEIKAKTPQDVLREENFVLIAKESGREVYYRPKEVKKSGDLIWYNTTIFFTSSANKYGLRSYYVVISCKEKKIITVGMHHVPYIGKASYTDYSKNGIKAYDIKPITSKVDTIMYRKLCR